MNKTKTRDLKFRPDHKAVHPDIDPDVKLPAMVRHAAATAEALSRGKPVPPAPQSKQAGSRRFKYTDAQINRALQDCDRGGLKHGDPGFEIIEELAREGARHIKARRRGAQQPRENSQEVTRRLEAILQSYGELSSKRQKTPTGAKTVAAIRQSVIQKLGLEDDDDAISEDVIKNDIQQLKPIIRLIKDGIIPLGKPTRQSGVSDKTRLEMEAGAKAVSKGEARKRTVGARVKNKKAK